MKQLGIAMLLGLSLLLSACGGGHSNSTVSGNWTASLSNPDGTPAFAFTTFLNQNNGTVVTVTTLGFTTATRNS